MIAFQSFESAPHLLTLYVGRRRHVAKSVGGKNRDRERERERNARDIYLQPSFKRVRIYYGRTRNHEVFKDCVDKLVIVDCASIRLYYTEQPRDVFPPFLSRMSMYIHDGTPKGLRESERESERERACFSFLLTGILIFLRRERKRVSSKCRDGGRDRERERGIEGGCSFFCASAYKRDWPVSDKERVVNCMRVWSEGCSLYTRRGKEISRTSLDSTVKRAVFL